MAELTPMMKQYFDIKSRNPDCLLFFRLGDFYEMFYDDAKTASKELELVLTGKDCGQDERAPMCGIPYHSSETYIARLVSRGYKVAICEQMEDPALAKGLVKRDIIRVITPGTVIEGSMLDESKNNYLCVISAAGKREAGLCFADCSTGELHVTSVKGADVALRVNNELARFTPSEVLLNEAASKIKEIPSFITMRMGGKPALAEEEHFEPAACEKLILRHFQKDKLDELGLEPASQAVSALGCALKYIYATQMSGVERLTDLDVYTDVQYMRLDLNARRNLELLETMRSKEKRGSLLGVLDRTKTAMGKRLMRQWIEQPLINPAQIVRRQNAVEELVGDTVRRGDILTCLGDIFDLERIMTRIVYGSANAKELRSLAQTIASTAPIKQKLAGSTSQMLQEIDRLIDPLDDVRDLIEHAIVEDPPFLVREGGMIKEGYSKEVDDLRFDMSDGKGVIARIEEQEKERTGIKNLKVGYNRVFGYYIEVSRSYTGEIPENYIRKQTLANAERYITQELKELEARILGAKDRVVTLEYQLFTEVRTKVAAELHRIQRTAQGVAQLDVLCSLAEVAVRNQYTRPQILVKGPIRIHNGRHPVVESIQNTPFVPNDTELNDSDCRVALITGPNMAGKSTYMRQTALIVLMAQIGSFVPCDSAEIGIVDSIYTRVGASDDLAAGQSTFMVEMSEVAAILKSATANSLIIFDEIGRGTSTYDGMSIARAVLEYVADAAKLGSKTLFATHYHELTAIENEIAGIKNFNIAVKKRGDEITFLRRIVPGPADDSYGIEVAKLAGIPEKVVVRAKEVLRSIENGEKTPPKAAAQTETAEQEQLSFTGAVENELVTKLKKIDVNTLTPIEAMQELYSLVNEAKAQG